jgi:hypothetical protein
MSKKQAAAEGLAIAKLPQSYKGFLARQLSNIPSIDAVFIYLDEELVHVYSVVPDFSFDLYPKLEKRERKVEKDFPDVKFEFHVRAHQGRPASRAVPLGSQLVFLR